MDVHLVGNVVGEPIQPLIQPLTRGRTSALDVPAPTTHISCVKWPIALFGQEKINEQAG